jgi:ribonuclease BN (tRNA processing enzyme)
MLDDAIALREFAPGDRLEVGPFGLCSWLLPHWMPNAGLRLEASGQVLAYTGDTGPSPLLAELARGADVFLAEATEPWQLAGSEARYLSTARQAGEVAREAGAGRLVLTHLWPGTDPEEAVRAAAESYPGEIAVAVPGLVAEPGLQGE